MQNNCYLKVAMKVKDDCLSNMLEVHSGLPGLITAANLVAETEGKEHGRDVGFAQYSFF